MAKQNIKIIGQLLSKNNLPLAGLSASASVLTNRNEELKNINELIKTQ